jgi:hypothetical protein
MRRYVVDVSTWFAQLSINGPTQVTMDLRGLLINGNQYNDALGLPTGMMQSARTLLVDGTPNAGGWASTPNYNRYNCDDPAWIEVNTQSSVAMLADALHCVAALIVPCSYRSHKLVDIVSSAL